MIHGLPRGFEYVHFTLSNNNQSQADMTAFLVIATRFREKSSYFQKDLIQKWMLL